MSKRKQPKPRWRFHSEDRMWLRYNRDLTDEDYAAISQLIQEGRGAHIATQSYRVRVWDVPYMGHMLRVIYDTSLVFQRALLRFLRRFGLEWRKPLQIHRDIA